ncbi:MAP3K7 [Bugula neritina]|uniref:MAP3K7 n=1 Tax=Bugula neritina TaxID=10212 RepID=A0A7J7KPQ2_BUGNE|nr:MAP3K7 [Bugula neritina]
MPSMKVDGLMLLGDLNARHESWGDHQQNRTGITLLDFIQRLNMEVVYKHDKPTFLCDNGSSYIDLFVATENIARHCKNQFTDDTVELFTGAPHRGHVPIITMLDRQKSTVIPTKYFRWNEADWYSFSYTVETMCEQHMSDFCTSSDPDNIWKTLKRILLKCKELFVPMAVSNVHNKPYWNKELSELSTRLREARRQFKYRSSYENGDKLDQIKAQFKAMLAAAQQRYLESKSKKLNDHNGETFWKDFKSLFYKKGENLVGDLVGANGEIIEDDANKAEYMFNKIFGGSSNYCPPTSPTMTQKSAIPLYNSQLQQLSQPITIQEITQALAKLKTSGKSSDFDGIHPKMLKQEKNFFLIALHCLFNKILSTHQWPWNSSNLVIFLRKPGKKDYKDVSSYRPITISSHIGKTLERIMEQRLRSLVETWSLIPNSQFGFRQGRSTLMYLLNLLTETTHYTKSKLCTAALFLDLQKAFDTVNHQHMIYRLQELGLEGNYLHVIDSFLTKREISLKINNHIHPATKCQIGLPQGSVLSPLLFIIYIRDMLSSIDGTGLQYADDCTVLMTGKDSSELQIRIENNCQQIQTWMDRWNLLINYQKTEIVVFNGDITPQL